MLSNLRIYKCGNTYKYISLPVFDTKAKDYYVNDKILTKRDNNLIRAKTKVKDLIYCNDFMYFITITVNPKYNRYDLTSIRKLVNHRIRTARQFTGKRLHFLFIPEQHKNGAWHLHGVISGDYADFITDNEYLFYTCSIFNSIGFNSVSKIKDIDRVGAYITKYITKEMDKIHKFRHTYFASHGLNRPVLIKSFLYNNEYFNHQFFDLKSDFCYVKYDKKYYNSVTNLL